MSAISNQRAAELLCIAAHWVEHLYDGDDGLEFDELLVVIAGAAGLVASNLPTHAERYRIFTDMMLLASRTAEDARSPEPVAPAVAHGKPAR